jgi:antitoxin MazE
MLVSVIPIGNSKGIRLPKNIINELKIEDKVEMEIHNKAIVIRRIEKKPRQGWADAFAEMHKKGDDKPLIQDLKNESFDWEW